MTKKKLSDIDPQQKKVINSLRERLLFTLGFMQNVQDFPAGKRIEAMVRAAADSANVRQLRLLAKEIDLMATLATPAHEREGLEALLKARLGVDKDLERANLQDRMAAILRRGRVRTEKEKQHVEEYLEILIATHADPSAIAKVQLLLGQPRGQFG